MAKGVNVEELERQTEEMDKKPKDHETGVDTQQDMDFSDEEREGAADTTRQPPAQSQQNEEGNKNEQNSNMFSLPPPPLPNFPDDNNGGMGNFDWGNMGGEGFPFNANGNDIPPPPPLMDAPWMQDNLLNTGPGGPGLLPTPPRGLMNQQQPRGYPLPLMGSRRPPMDNGNFNNMQPQFLYGNNFRSRGPRGSPMGGGPIRGGGSPFFRGGARGNFRGNFRGARGRW